MSRSTERGFTLVELLVVVTIIALLIALLLPAVQAAREAARRIECTNKIRQLALAVHLYHDHFDQFPPGYGYMTGPKGSGAGKGPEWAWESRVFPYLDQAAADAAIDWGAYWSSYPTNSSLLTGGYPILQCPSDSTVKKNFMGIASWTKGVSRGSYAGSFGYGDPTVSNSAGMERPGHIDGVFFRNAGLSLTQIQDGTSNTLMLAELIPGGNLSLRGAWWYAEGPVFMEQYTPNDSMPDLVRVSRCNPEDQAAGALAPCMASLGEYYMIVHTARSRHPGGVMTAMCDGSAAFTSDGVSLAVWRALGSPHGGEVVTAR